MRKRTALEPRLMALSEAELVALHQSRSWIPQTATRASMDPTRWSQRARQESYWRMVDIWTQQRTVLAKKAPRRLFAIESAAKATPFASG